MTEAASRWQEFSNGLYRSAARIAATVLARSPLVESVYARRSVAAGEVDFGRSDIDLGVFLRGPGTGPELLSLLETFRLLRVAIPVVGECQFYDPVDLRWSFHADPYRASLDRRSAILLQGTPVQIPSAPISPEQAAWRFAFWFEQYLPAAIRRGNLRNLRKFVLELWNARATAAGMIAQPFLSRRETEEAWRNSGEFPPQGLPPNAAALLVLAFHQAAHLHAALRPPLQPLSSALIFRGLLAPALESRQFVIIPDSSSALPAEAFHRDSALFTPQALDLYLHYANPYVWWILPPAVRDLGIVQPDLGAFERACRMYGARFRIRSPGFEKGSPSAAVGRVAVSLHTLALLNSGHYPLPMRPEAIQCVLQTPPSVRDYYSSIYPRVLNDNERLWETLAVSRETS